MLNKITLYIAISVAVIFGGGYCTGHYVASSKAERDIAAIRTIFEQQQIEKEMEKAEEERILEETIKKSKGTNQAHEGRAWHMIEIETVKDKEG